MYGDTGQEVLEKFPALTILKHKCKIRTWVKQTILHLKNLRNKISRNYVCETLCPRPHACQ